MRFLSVPVALLVLLLVAAPVAAAAARQATPEASPVSGDGLLDLAAMALTAADLPPGYGLDVERYLSAEQIPAFGTPWLSPEEVAATGVRRFYDSLYLAEGGQGALRSYFGEYGSPEEAEAGFAVFEDEERLPPDFAPLTHEDLPGPGVGEEPAEITFDTFTFGSALPEGQYVDATFRVGRILAGVALDAPYPSASDGTPAAAATPGARPAPDPEAIALVTALASVLEERIEAVLAGESPDGTDLALPGALLPVDPGLIRVEEGYVAGAEELAGFELPDAGGELLAAYVRASAVGEPRPRGSQAPDLQGLPHVVAGVADFASAAAAAEALERAAEGVLGLPPGGPREPAGEPEIHGADAAFAYRASAMPLPGVSADSFGVAMAVGDRLAVVAVIGAPGAEDAALELAGRQAACLTGDACGPASLAGLEAGAGAGTPAASPAAGAGGDEAAGGPLVAATVDVPPDAFVGLFRVDYAPGAGEESGANPGPILNVVAAGTLSVALDGPALLTRAETADEAEEVGAGDEVELGPGDGLVVPGGTAHTYRNAGEGAVVLLSAVLLPFDAAPPAPVEGVELRGLAFGPPPAPGENDVALERVSLAPGAEVAPPALFAVAAGNPEQTAEGGLRNTGDAPAEVLILTYDLAEEHAPPGAEGMPAATPEA